MLTRVCVCVQGIVANEALAYFVGRIYQFMIHIGVDESKYDP